ncbi:MAG: phytanoyl-CoA dioxygenase family protein [Myxococcales bacterium]|nr:phytanoyl-CoA dioxygenase family protein [Myxococcales bacterium]
MTLWTALDDAPVASGCVELVPGSHRGGLATPAGGTIPDALVDARGGRGAGGRARCCSCTTWSGTARAATTTARPRRAVVRADAGVDPLHPHPPGAAAVRAVSAVAPLRRRALTAATVAPTSARGSADPHLARGVVRGHVADHAEDRALRPHGRSNRPRSRRCRCTSWGRGRRARSGC